MEIDKTSQIKEAILEILPESDLNQNIIFKEVEAVLPNQIDHKITLEARVSKAKEIELQEFQTILYDMIAEKIGVSEATKFMKESFKSEIGISTGDKFQSIDVNDISGNKVSLSHNNGDVLMIDLWATWCRYCQEPMQHNIDIVKKNKDLYDSKNIRIVGVSRDENVSQWKNHVNTKQWESIPQYVRQDICDRYGIRGIPAVVLINKEGKIAFAGHPGNLDLEQTLLNLAEGKPVSKKGENLSGENINPEWSNLDTETKKELVSSANAIMKDMGSGSRCVFIVKTTRTFDKDFKLVEETIPTFFGEVTPNELENIQTFATTLESQYNLKDPKFQVKVLQITGNEDF